MRLTEMKVLKKERTIPFYRGFILEFVSNKDSLTHIDFSALNSLKGSVHGIFKILQ